MTNKIKLLIVAFTICMGYTTTINAQKLITQGIATYTVKYNLPPDQQQLAGMLPTEYQMYFKDNFSKFKIDMGMFSSQIIHNNITGESLTLTDLPIQGKKVAMKMPAVKFEEEDYEIIATKETSKIAGYNCIKYILKTKSSNESGEIWITKDIKIPGSTFTANLSKIKGVPIKFTSNVQGMDLDMTLKSIVEQPISAINMDIPAGYETMSFEDAMKQMGQ